MKMFFVSSLSVCAIASLVLSPSVSYAQTQSLTKISVATDGGEANGHSSIPHVSGNGKFVCFTSAASNLVPDDTNGLSDVFLWQKRDASITRVSLSPEGFESNGPSSSCVVSRTGRYVVFATTATNFFPEDTDSVRDIVLLDRRTGQRELISVTQSNTGGDEDSYPVHVSDNGRFILFYSRATSLVSNDTNGARDVFLRDRRAQTTTRISVASDGSEANEDSVSSHYQPMSANSRFIVLTSRATNLHPGIGSLGPGVILGYVHDRRQGTTTLASFDANANPLTGLGTGGRMLLSRNGKRIIYPAYDESDSLPSNDNNLALDTYIKNRRGTSIRLVSENNLGEVGQGGFSSPRGISQTGRYVLLRTTAKNFAATSPYSDVDQIMLKDMVSGNFYHLSKNTADEAGNGEAFSSSLSANGRVVAFESESTNLVQPDNGQFFDIFVSTIRVPADRES